MLEQKVIDVMIINSSGHWNGLLTLVNKNFMEIYAKFLYTGDFVSIINGTSIYVRRNKIEEIKYNIVHARLCELNLVGGCHILFTQIMTSILAF